MLKSTAPVKIPVFALNKFSPSWEQDECEREQSYRPLLLGQGCAFGLMIGKRMVLGGGEGACREAMGDAPLAGSTWYFGGSWVVAAVQRNPSPLPREQGSRRCHRDAAGISASLGAEDQGYPTRTGTVGNPRSCADCVKCTPFPRAYRHSYKRSKDGRNDIPLLIIVWSHLYIWCYVTNSSLLFSSREILL